jgi:hypothetical protein
VSFILPVFTLTSRISSSPIRSDRTAHIKEKSSDVLVNNLTTSYFNSLEKMVVLTSVYDYENLIKSECEKLNCDAAQVIRIMYCESKGFPNATNGMYRGLFQHHAGYWIERSRKYGLEGYDVYDPFAQIMVTTNMFADGLWYHWKCR